MNLYGVTHNVEPEEDSGDDVDTWQEEEEFLKERGYVLENCTKRAQPLLVRSEPRCSFN